MFRMKMLALPLVATALSMSALPVVQAEESAETTVTTVLMQAFDKPDNHLTAAPVAVSGDWAVADWSQGNMGGRALLHRAKGAWSIFLCSGDSLKEAASLQSMGLSQGDAKAIADSLAAAEQGVDPARLKLLASFEGIVKMGDIAQ